MVEFFAALAAFSSRFSIEALSLNTADPTLSLVNQFLSASVLPILFSTQTKPTIVQSEQLFSSFMDHLPGYAWIKDLDGRYVYVNNQVKQLPQYQHAYLGKTDAELWPPDLAAVYRANDLEAIATKEKVEAVESFVLNGEHRHVLVIKFPIVDENGTIIMVGGTSIDITEQKRVEEALRESERFRRMIFESEPECVKVVAPDYTLLDMNPAGLEMIGANSREQVVGQSVLSLIAPECQDTFTGMHQRVCQGESVVMEFEIIGLDGTRRWMESHAAPLLDKESRVIAQLAITRDVTEHRRAERRIGRSERQLAEAQRIAHIGSWSANLNKTTQFWSDELYRIYGLERGSVSPTYEAFLDLVHPEDRLWLGESVERASQTREPIDIYFRLVRPDGEERIIHSCGRVIYDDQGNPIRMFGTAQDVTEQVRAEAALRAAEQKYRDIFENAVEGIFQSTPDGRFIAVNPALVKMSGFSSAEELIGERVDISQQHYVDPKRRVEFKRLLEEQGVVKGFEFEAYRKDGSTVWMSESVRAVRDEGGQVLYYEGTTQDITERRQSDHSLRLFRNLIDRSTDSIEVIDPDTLRFLDCNKSAHQDLGYSREEFLSLSLYDIDPLVNERMAAWLSETLERSGFVIFESIHRRKDGSTFPVEVNLKTVSLEKDYRLAVVRDITERKVAEEALHEAGQKYRRIFENATEGIFQSTPDGRVIAANPALARLFGFASPEDLIKNRQDVSRQLYVDPTQHEEFRRQLEEHGSVRGFEHQVFRKDGSKVWISANAHAVRNAQGGIQYYEGTVQDITERKRAEQALQQAEQKYRELFENAKDAIYVHDLNGRYTSVNRAVEKLSGYSREEILGKHFSHFVAPEHAEQMRGNFCKKLRQEGETTYEIEVITQDGRRVPVEVSSRLIYEEGVPVAIQGTARNIFERKRAEEALRGYSRQLIQAQEAERQSIARELHDQIGQVLTAIRIHLETIRDFSHRAESTELLDDGVTLVDEAIQQVRDLSFELRPSLLDDLGLAAALRWYSDRFAQRTGLRVTTRIKLAEATSRLPLELETACFRIVQEALTNVARHAQAKNVLIDLVPSNDGILLSIKDDGIGFNGHSWNAPSSHLLGLRGMQERALALGGKLEINSASSGGTEIRAQFPHGGKGN